MKTRILAAMAALAYMACDAGAQTLSTEVVVDRTVLPAERAASRPAGLVPALTLPPVAAVDLATADYTALSPITRAYLGLAPVEAPLLGPVSAYRGYASVGYFPSYNLGMSAGYRVINNERVRLSLHAQFDGEKYKASGSPKDHSPEPYGTKDDYGYNGARVAADLGMAFGASSHLVGRLRVGYSDSHTPYRGPQSLFSGGLGLLWLSRAGSIDYKVGFSADFDSYGESGESGSMSHRNTYRYYTGYLDSYNEQVYSFALGAAYRLDGMSRIGLDVDGRFKNSGEWSVPALGGPFRIPSDVSGYVGLTPYFSLSSSSVKARIGLSVDFENGFDGNKLRLAPRIHLAWDASPRAAVYIDVNGGSRANTSEDLRQITPYLPGIPSSVVSYIPVDAEAGVNIGPFEGFTARLFGGYSVARDWAMAGAGPATLNGLSYADVRGWHVGAELAYSFRRIARVTVSAQAAPSKPERAYYMWRDHASSVLGARLDLTPLDRLKVGVSYEFRGGRGGYDYDDITATSFMTPMGCVSDLGVSASYGLTDAVSVFARGENLLGRRYTVLCGIESQGVHGLAGVSVKF